jgi:SNF2 family DNA or RNA helicase
VVLCEPCFRVSTEEQAYGRAARLGQRRVVHVYPVFLENTIEQTIMQLPRRGRLNMQQALFGADN